MIRTIKASEDHVRKAHSAMVALRLGPDIAALHNILREDIDGAPEDTATVHGQPGLSGYGLHKPYGPVEGCPAHAPALALSARAILATVPGTSVVWGPDQITSWSQFTSPRTAGTNSQS